jgi:hypothetical protein
LPGGLSGLRPVLTSTNAYLSQTFNLDFYLAGRIKSEKKVRGNIVSDMEIG